MDVIVAKARIARVVFDLEIRQTTINTRERVMDQRPVKFVLSAKSVANYPEFAHGFVVDRLSCAALLLLGERFLDPAGQLISTLDVVDPAVEAHASRGLINGVLDLAWR